MTLRERAAARSTLALFVLGVLLVMAGASVSADVGEANSTYTYRADFGALGLGARHSCSVRPDGRIYCWGRDDERQLGNDDFRISSATPVLVANITDAVAVSGGFSHTCALTATGAVYCWGEGSGGLLGNGSSTDHGTPVAVTGLSSGISSIAVGSSHACAVTAGGGLKCWGNNARGQMGDNTTNQASVPYQTYADGSGVEAVAAGDWSTCALFTGGSVKCWGGNAAGQLGTGDTNQSLVPVQVTGLTSGVVAISSAGIPAQNGAYSHTCALMSDGAVKCWGDNQAGQLGVGDTTDRLTPTDVTLPAAAVGLATGSGHTCALLTGGALYCWGQNSGQQLGDGTVQPRSQPTAVVGMSSGIRSVAAGETHTCATRSDGLVQCWGSNVDLQLGDGTNVVIPSTRLPSFPSTSTLAPNTTSPPAPGSSSVSSSSTVVGSSSTSSTVASSSSSSSSSVVSNSTSSSVAGSASSSTSTTDGGASTTTPGDGGSTTTSTTDGPLSTEVASESATDPTLLRGVSTTIACEGSVCTATTRLPTVGGSSGRIVLAAGLSVGLGSFAMAYRRRLL